MKRHLIIIAALFVAIILIDAATGLIFSRLTSCARGGDTARNEYICNLTTEDLLIFGSSRAIHHYDPSVLADSTGLSCYNCGQDGNGAILNYGRYHLICQRYHPKVVIYDVMPLYDYLAGEDNSKYLGWLRPYYDRDGIAEIFKSVDPKEEYKMMSQMYRYNSRFIQILSDCLKPAQHDELHGFQPLDGELDTLKLTPERLSLSVDSLKLSYLKRMLDESEDTRFVLVVSPYWYGMDTALIEPVKQLCQQRGIMLLDFSNDPKYVGNDNYFVDGAHLNTLGAKEFTLDLLTKLKPMFSSMAQESLASSLAAVETR